MSKVIVATFLSLFLVTASWLWSGIEGHPTPNNLRPFVVSAGDDEIRQLRELHHRPLMISNVGHRQLLHHQTIDFIQMPKIVKRSVIQPDILNITERQSRGESSDDADDFKVAAVENELNQLSETVNSIGNNLTTNNIVGPATAAGNQSSGTKFWGVAKSVDGNEDYVSFQESPLLLLPEKTSNETLAQFFGITNIYVGQPNNNNNKLINKKQSELITGAPDVVVVPDCPVCPSAATTNTVVECPIITQLPEHIILTVTACESFGSSLGTCSVASIAPSGTIFVLFSSSSSSSSSSIKRSSSGSSGRKGFARYLKKNKKNGNNNNNNSHPIVATAVIGVVASAPNTKVKMTCPYIPTDVTVTTQNGPVLPYKPREEAGFIQLIVTGALSSEKYTMACVWSSSP